MYCQPFSMEPSNCESVAECLCGWVCTLFPIFYLFGFIASDTLKYAWFWHYCNLCFDFRPKRRNKYSVATKTASQQKKPNSHNMCVQGASSEYGAIMNICWLFTWCQKIKHFDSISSTITSLHADDINIWIMDKNSTGISDVQQDLFMFLIEKTEKFNIYTLFNFFSEKCNCCSAKTSIKIFLFGIQ